MFALLPTLVSLLTSSSVVRTVEGAAALAGDLQKMLSTGGALVADVEALFTRHGVSAVAQNGTLVFHGVRPVEPGSPGPGSPEAPGAGVI